MQEALLITELLNGAATYIKVQTVGDRSGRKRMHYVNGKRLKGITGAALLESVLGDGAPHTRDELLRAFTARGFHAHSLSSVLSTAKTSGLVVVEGEVVRKPRKTP